MIRHAPFSRDSIPSPLITQIPHLLPAAIADLPYPPDLFPGARDVETCYGAMRVYEWGSETGRKVMLVHGDATCAPLWKRVANSLIDKGCRVIVLDLWGRGYTSTPLVPHDGRLLALQLLFAASSSPLPWCSETFSIVGFSLGGGIAMDFTASFPHLVRSVALMAPGGLIRQLPRSYVELRQAANDGKNESELRELLADVLGLGQEEPVAAAKEDVAANVDAMVRWQYEHHQGHATSFVSTLQYGPVQGQYQTWQKACENLKHKEGKDKTVVICGDEDFVVPPDHVKEDLDGMMGSDKFCFETVRGGHGFLLDEEACEQVVETLSREWVL